jgi:DNA polymerase-4
MAGEKTCEMLTKMGIEKVWQLAQTPVERLEKMFGVHGLSLWRKAHGLDDSPITPYHDAKSASAERTFDKDTVDVAFLHNLLRTLVERVAFQLRKDHQLASNVTVRIRYSDFTTVSKQATIPYTASDHVFAEKAVALFDQLYQKGRPVRLSGIRLGGLVHGGHQISMFDDKEEDIQLYKALDRIKMRYGASTVMRASGMGLVSKRPNINPFQKRDVE